MLGATSSPLPIQTWSSSTLCSITRGTTCFRIRHRNFRAAGMLIQSMNFTMDVAGQFSVLLILSVLGLILNGIVNGVRRRVLFWDVSQKVDAVASAQKKGGTL